MQHFEEEPKVFYVIRIVVVMDRKPEHGMCRRITVPYHTTIHPTRNKNWTLKTPRPLRRHKSEVVVPLHILLLKLVEFLYTVDSEVFHLFAEVVGGEFGDVALFEFVVAVGGDEVVGVAEDFLEAEGEVDHCSSLGGGGEEDAATAGRHDRPVG